MDGEPAPRDWNALLERVLKPFRSEAAAFRVLQWTVAIAAVVIGGTSLAGGRATIVGTVLGVITFALIFNLLTLMNLAVEIQQITKGAIILAAVLIQRRQN